MRSRLAPILAAFMVFGVIVAPAQAASPKPTPTPSSHPVKPPAPPKAGSEPAQLTPEQLMAGMTTNAMREAAAARAAAKGVKPATQNIKTGAKANAAATKAMAAAALTGPDYFGAFPNYANSQLPTGPVVSISGGGGSGATGVATPGASGGIASLTLTAGGTGYTSAPTVSITGPAGSTGAAATATITTDGVGALTVTPGSGYTAPVISFGGPGSGAAATATGGVDKINVTTPGAHYTAPVVTLNGGGGANATATASGVVDGVTLSHVGVGYTAPVVTITGGGGTGASAVASGIVDGLTMTNGGSGYTVLAPPVIKIGAGGPTDATAVATIDPVTFAIKTVTLTPGTAVYTAPPLVTISDTATGTAGSGTGASIAATISVTALGSLVPGTGYTSAPSIAITDTAPGTGSGAVAAATISITAVQVTAQGSGYTSAPSPAFSDPTGAGTGAVATATIGVTGATVTAAGTGYLTPPTVTIADTAPGAGSGATAIAIVSGVVTGLTVTAAGTGYVSGGIRKFVDTLPGLGSGAANNLGQYIPVAVADQASFPNSDYYEIGLVQYREQLHADLAPTLLRGYVQIETPANAAVSRHIPLTNANLNPALPPTPILDKSGNQVYGVDVPSYLGPIIVAQRNHADRIKFTNFLPTGAGGDLFIPVDTTDMGAGMGPVDANGQPCDPMMGGNCVSYTQNRATLHLHGGFTPWISDGTPDQWTTPATETTPYPKGVSVSYVPDMWFDANGNQVPAGTPGASNNPGDGSMTFYYTNQQSARLMFYHDHAYGITRLNVYAGEAAGFVLQDPVLDSTLNCTLTPVLGACAANTAGSLASKGIVPGTQIPLIIQDRTFVPNATQLAAEDPTWDTSKYGGAGNLWFPHVYMTNQNPADSGGVNAMGRWDYGPWFWPPYTGLVNGPVANPLFGTSPEENSQNPGIPNPSLVPEAFMDTPLVNGTAYPVLNVNPTSYRLSILNASNDRNLNLSLFQSAASFGTNGTNGVPNSAMWTGATLNNPDFGEVPMVPAVAGTPGTAGYTTPDQTDGRAGGVPDARAAGPSMIQIASEGGVLPAPVVLTNGPVGYNYNRRDIVVLNVSNKALFMGPAERADVIVDFSRFAGKTLILYNDAPAPVPAFDSRYDYYTGDPDQTSTGGAPTTLPGYGPNTRTIMQIVVAGGTPAPAFNLPALQAAWTGTNGAYAQSQDKPIVPEAAYNADFGTSYTNAYSHITDHSLWIGNPVNGVQLLTGGTGYTTAPAVGFVGGGGSGATAHAVVVNKIVTEVIVDTAGTGYSSAPVITFTGGGGTGASAVPIGWMYMQPKAIQELFETQYGRMNATLGIELPFTSVNTQTTIPLGYAEPTTEDISPSDLMTPVGTLGDGTQIWKITHNGVDTHTIHFHLFNVQVVNRVGWDGAIRPPDPNELGWKESVRMNPLEDAIVAIRPTIPVLPFKIGDSYRPIDVTRPTNASIATFDATTGNAINVINAITDFGWEYVWHCHLLGHEENDMMRPIVFNVSPAVPSGLAATSVPTPPSQAVKLDWSHVSATFPATTNFVIRRATDSAFTQNVTTFGLMPTPQSTPLIPYPTLTFTDTTVANGTTYWYEVRAENSVSYSQWSDSTSIKTLDGLNVTASSVTIPYGSTVPAITPIYVATSPPPSTPTTPATCTTTYTQGAPVGTYPSTCSGAAGGFLYIAYFPGTVTVTAAPVVVTAPAGLSVVYGSAAPAAVSLMTPTYSPPITPATPATCTTTYSQGMPVGTYPITCSGAADPNYTFTYVAGTLAVTPATLTVTAPSPSKAYGAALPALTPTITGFVLPDSVASLPTAPTCTTTALASSPVGTYPVTCAGGVATNYTFNYVPGTLTVNPVALTITASSATVAYGAAVPPISPTYVGFVNGDTAGSLTTLPFCSTTAVAGSPVGAYPSTCSGATSLNYTIGYVAGTVTIAPVVLTITASSGTMSYGGTVPTITPSYAGFVNGDTFASLTTQPTCSTTATSTSSVAGSPYPSSCTGAVDPNYTITYVPGTVTVTAVALVITAPSGTMPFGGPVPAFAPSFAGFVGTDTAASLTTQPTCTPSFTTTTAAGTYATACSGAVDPNYTISYVAGSVTVTPVALVITAPSGTMPFGGPVPAFAPSFAGFVAGDTPASLTTQPICIPTFTTTTSAQTYVTTCSGAVDPNYTISYVAGSVTVTPVALTITAFSGTMAYGSALPALTPTYRGLVAGNTAPATPPTCVTTATSTSVPGAYPSTCSGAIDSNYTISYVAGTITVVKAATTVAVTSSANPSVHGQSVTFTATVRPPAGSLGAVPAGTVQFQVNGANVGGLLTINASGVATYTTTTLTTAAHPVIATYGGNGNYLGATSPTLTQTVTAARTSATLTLVSPVSRRNTIRYTARVVAVAPGAGTPTGTVRFYKNSTLIGSATLNASGVAVLNYRNTGQSTGTFSMHVVYVGSTNFLTSTSPNVSQRITL